MPPKTTPSPKSNITRADILASLAKEMSDAELGDMDFTFIDIANSTPGKSENQVRSFIRSKISRGEMTKRRGLVKGKTSTIYTVIK